MRVAVDALHEMDVMEASALLEGCVHGFDGDPAIGKPGMAGAARRTRLLAMFQVAGQAAESFVDADGSAVLAGRNLPCGCGRVALVAQSLARVGTDSNRTCAVEHFGQRKFRQGNVGEFAAVKQSNGRTIDFLLAAGSGFVLDGFAQRCAFMMNFMAGEARNHGLCGESGCIQAPRAFRADRGDKVTNSPIEMHTVATQAIVH